MHTIEKIENIDYLLNKSIIIPKAHLKVCNVGSGNATCRYLCLTVNGFVCSKNTPLKINIDKQVYLADAGKCKFVAKGNNCEGFGDLNEIQKKENL